MFLFKKDFFYLCRNTNSNLKQSTSAHLLIVWINLQFSILNSFSSGFNRAQILFYIGENLEVRKSEFATRISVLTGKSIEASLEEVEKSIQRLFYWAAFSDKVKTFLKMDHPRPLFRLFKQTLQSLQQINVKNVHSVYGAGIRNHDLQNMSLLS